MEQIYGKTNPWMASTFMLAGVLVGFVISQFSGNLLANIFIDSPPTSAVGFMKAYAKDLSLNKSKFNDCVDSGKVADTVRSDINLGSEYGVSGTPTFFVNGRTIGGAQPYASFQKMFDSLLNKKEGDKIVVGDEMQKLDPKDPDPTPLTEEQYQSISDDLSAGGTIQGVASAPITMVEFSDFQCPYCGRFFEQTLPSIEDNYVKTGKVKVIFKNFPLNFHPHAEKASEAALCAGEQGKFWEMHDALFKGQTDWSAMAKTTDDKK